MLGPAREVIRRGADFLGARADPLRAGGDPGHDGLKLFHHRVQIVADRLIGLGERLSKAMGQISRLQHRQGVAQ